MTLYHGSESIIEAPEFGKGARNNDYGKGFYCTENIELAREWACAKNKNGYVNVYEFDLTDLKDLNLNDRQYHILNWLAILADNRTYWQRGSIAEEAKEYIKTHFLLDVSPYDVIIGYRADDSYFAFATAFLEGSLTYDYLVESIRLGKLGYQCAVKSEKAFARLKELSVKEVNSTKLKTEYLNRDKIARNTFRDYSKKSAYDIARSRNKVKTIYDFIGDD